MKEIITNVFLVAVSLLCLLVVISLIQAKINHREAFVLGIKPYIIQTGSMSPALKTSGIVLVKQGGFKKLKKGDIVVFHKSGLQAPISHRLVDFTASGGLVTKGDYNNVIDDETVTQERYIGRVFWSTNTTANLINLTKSPAGIMLLLLPVALGLILFCSWNFIFHKHAKTGTKIKVENL